MPRNQLAAPLREAKAEAGGLAGGIGKIGVAAIAVTAGIKGITAAVNLLGDSIRMAGEAELTELSFGTLLGDADKAKSLINDLRTLARDTSLTTGGTMGLSKQLLGAGIDADQIIPTIRAIGTATAMADNQEEAMKLVALQYIQARGQGQLYWEDMKEILSQAPMLREAMEESLNLKAQGMSLKEYIGTGKAGFNDLVKGLKHLTEEGGKAHGMLDVRAQTYVGKLDQMQEAWDNVKRGVGKVLIEELGLHEAAMSVTNSIMGMGDGVDSIRPAVRVVKELFVAVSQQVRTVWTLGREIYRVVARIGRETGLADLAERGLKAFNHMWEQGRKILSTVIRVGGAIGEKIVMPLLKATGLVDRVSDTFDKIMDLKIDEDKLADSLFDAAEVGARFTGQMIDGFIRMKDVINKYVVNPLKVVFEYIKAVINGIPTMADMTSGVLRLSGFQGMDTRKLKEMQQRGLNTEGINAALKGLNQGVANMDLSKAGVWEERLVSAVKDARAEYERSKNAVGGLVGAASEASKALLNLPEELSAAAKEAAKSAKNDFGFMLDPIKELRDHEKALREAVVKNALHPTLAQASLVSKFRSLAESRLGGMTVKLPTANELGSKEFASAQTRAMVGQGPQGVKDVLLQMLRLMEQQIPENRKLYHEITRALMEMGAPPVEVK